MTFAAYWNDWGSYGSCSRSCGSGTKTRDRSCHQRIGSCYGSSSQSSSCTYGSCGTITTNAYFVTSGSTHWLFGSSCPGVVANWVLFPKSFFNVPTKALKSDFPWTKFSLNNPTHQYIIFDKKGTGFCPNWVLFNIICSKYAKFLCPILFNWNNLHVCRYVVSNIWIYVICAKNLFGE